MISAWDVYWVMQLDSIGNVAFAMSFIGTIAGTVATVSGLIAKAEGEDFGPGVLRVGKSTLAVAALSILACAFLPSTKTAAAMIVLPAIANNETLQHEAGDLYRLAKKALSDAVGAEPEAKE